MERQAKFFLFSCIIINTLLVISPSPVSAANLLFRSGFEGSVSMGAINNCYGTGCHQPIVGTDSATGYSWPLSVWGGSSDFHMLVDAPVTSSTVGNYMYNQIQTVTGHDGKQTRALYSAITKSGCCGTNSQGGGSTQNPYELHPARESGDIYISYWLMLQPDLVQKMTPQTWRPIFEWKTAGDYRVIAQVVTYGNVAPWWQIIGDNNANGGLAYQRFWEVQNKTVAVPVGQWFKFEVFWHRSSGNDGRVWMAVNGNVIADHFGPNVGVKNAPINRIMMPNLYSGSTYPIYQWVDDVEIWDGFPQSAGSIPPAPSISPTAAPAPTPEPTSTTAPAPATTTTSSTSSTPVLAEATAPSTSVFSIGSQTKTAVNLKVRSTASAARNSNVLCVQRKGSSGILTAGPVRSGGYTWWKVNFDRGCDGWGLETYIAPALLAKSTKKKLL